MQHRTALYSYLFSCVRNHADAEDLLQNVSMAVMESFEQLTSEDGFLPWAREIARRRILAHRRTHKRESPYDPEILQALAEAADRVEPHRYPRAPLLPLHDRRLPLRRAAQGRRGLRHVAPPRRPRRALEGRGANRCRLPPPPQQHEQAARAHVRVLRARLCTVPRHLPRARGDGPHAGALLLDVPRSCEVSRWRRTGGGSRRPEGTRRGARRGSSRSAGTGA